MSEAEALSWIDREAEGLLEVAVSLYVSMSVGDVGSWWYYRSQPSPGNL